MTSDDLPYVIRCPRCGDAMTEHSRDYFNGVICESTDECEGCGFIRDFSYGNVQEYQKDITNGDPMAAKLIGMYDHLEKDEHFKIELSMTSVVESVKRMNYGEHRFLSELVRQRKASETYVKNPEYKYHTDRLEELINNGYY